MYRITKPKGSLSNITITNEETLSSMNMGRCNWKIRGILKESLPTAELDTRDEWNIEVTDKIAKSLLMTGYSGKKPVREKTKETAVHTDEQKEPASQAKKPSAYDFLFGYSDDFDDDEEED